MGTFRDRTSMERVLFAIFSYQNKTERTATLFAVTHEVDVTDDLDGGCTNRYRGYIWLLGILGNISRLGPDGRSGKKPCAKLPGVHRAALSRYGAMRRCAVETLGQEPPMCSRRTLHNAIGETQ